MTSFTTLDNVSTRPKRALLFTNTEMIYRSSFVCVILAAGSYLGLGCGGATKDDDTQATVYQAPTDSSVATVESDAGDSNKGALGPALDAGAGDSGVIAIGPMNSPVPSTKEAELKALGLDIRNLPPLDSLDKDTLHKVMKTFTPSLGIKCSHCHEKDFAVPTANKQIAFKMWDTFVRQLSMADGSPLYCDSCHQGNAKFLDRTDKKVLGKWMHENFVDKLVRKDDTKQNCKSCHGDPFVGTFLTNWSSSN